MDILQLPLRCPTCFLVLSLPVVFLTFLAVYRLFVSPLSTVPGPWYAAISSFWLRTHVLRFRRCQAIDDLLHKYGPVVRVAPNMVIFLDSPTMKVVYGARSKLSKGPFYKSLMMDGNDISMSTLEHGPHLIRKRGYVAHYTPANLAHFQPDFHCYVNEMVDLLSSVAKEPLLPVDTLLLLHHLLIDVNCMHIFSYDAGSLKALSRHIHHGDPPDELSRATGDFPILGSLRSALPNYLWALIRHIPCHRWKLFCNADVFLDRFTSARLKDVQTSLLSGNHEEDTKKPLITRLLGHRYSEQEAMPEKDVISECVAHLIAGTDTTSMTLTYILWELGRRRDIMLRLQTEVDENMPDPSQIPDIQELQKLPFLTAVIKEGLRVYSPAPSPLERVAPDSTETEISLLGHRMPSGTIIASQAFSSHRHPGVFFSPDLFLPDRWLLEDVPTMNGTSTNSAVPQTPTASATSSSAASGIEKGASASMVSTLQSSTTQAQMTAHMFPFGYGPRVCAGQNVAQIMLRLVLVAIARNFDIVVPPETNEKSMAMRDSFAAFPAALECKLIFVPRSK